MSRFLLKHPATHFVASSETCSKLIGDSLAELRHSGVSLTLGRPLTIRGDKAEIVVMRLEHGGDPDMNNLAFIVRSNDYTILHVGDARLSHNEEYLRTVDWVSYNVDLLFIEYFDQSSQTRGIIESMIKPKHVILMHIPPGSG